MRRAEIVRRRGSGAWTFLRRVVAFALLWMILTGGSPDDPLVAGAVVLLAAASSTLLWPAGRRRLRYPALLQFVPYFLLASFQGGWDVAKRALHPKLPLEPGFIEYRFRLTGRPARIFFALLVSLLPGTASSRLGGEGLLVHVLDLRMANVERLAELESRVAGLLGIGLDDDA